MSSKQSENDIKTEMSSLRREFTQNRPIKFRLKGEEKEYKGIVSGFGNSWPVSKFGNDRWVEAPELYEQALDDEGEGRFVRCIKLTFYTDIRENPSDPYRRGTRMVIPFSRGEGEEEVIEAYEYDMFENLSLNRVQTTDVSSGSGSGGGAEIDHFTNQPHGGRRKKTRRRKRRRKTKKRRRKRRRKTKRKYKKHK